MASTGTAPLGTESCPLQYRNREIDVEIVGAGVRWRRGKWSQICEMQRLLSCFSPLEGMISLKGPPTARRPRVCSHCSHISRGGHWLVLPLDLCQLCVLQLPSPAWTLA